MPPTSDIRRIITLQPELGGHKHAPKADER